MSMQTAEPPALDSVSFQIRCDTAMFSHGASPRASAEPRVFEFRGMARYWFRAAIGPYVSLQCSARRTEKNTSCTCLRCLEGSVFGSTTAGAVLRLRLDPVVGTSTTRRFLLPHHPPNGTGRDHPSPSPAILAGATWALHLERAHPFVEVETNVEERPDPDQARKVLQRTRVFVAASSLWLALHLGGIGQRSRRGAGSVTVVSISPPLPTDFPAPFHGGTLQDLANHLSRGIRASLEVIRSFANPTGNRGSLASPPPFPMLLPDRDVARVQVVPLRESGLDEQEARAEVMRGLKKYKNAVFGLPYLKPASGDSPVQGRHASPLWIRLVPLDLSRGTWAMVQTAMRSATLPPQGNWAKLEQYLNQQPSAVAVFP